MYIYIYIYVCIYMYVYISILCPNLPKNVLVRLPVTRSGHSQDQEIIYNELKDKGTLFMFMFTYFCLDVFFLYKCKN